MKGQTGFSAWDFVTVMTALTLTDGRWIIVASSINHPDLPEVKGKVRGKIYIDGYILTPDPETESWFYLTYVTKSDMGGLIPKFVKNLIVNSTP